MPEQDYVAVVSLLGLEFRHDVIEVTHVACAASRIVLKSMCNKDKAAMEAYYHRLLNKCRDLDSTLQLDTNMDLASQPAWIRYCKECLNLVVLREVLHFGRIHWVQITGTDIESVIDRSRQEVYQVNGLQETFELSVSVIFGRDKTIARTGQQLLDGFDFIQRMYERSCARDVVLDYYFSRSVCREWDKVVEDIWEYRPSKFKEWQQFSDNCHIALLYWMALHGRQLVISRISPQESANLKGSVSGQADQDNEQHLSLLTATLMQRSPEAAAGTLPNALIDTPLKLGDGGSSGSSVPNTDTTLSEAKPPCKPFLCVVRDKLVWVVDKSSLDLAGKDGKTWDPQPPNILLCRLKPKHKIVLDVSWALPNHEGVFIITSKDLLEVLDAGCMQFSTLPRDKIEDMAEAYLEHLSTMDYEQLRCHHEIGIAAAYHRMKDYHDTYILLRWMWQFLYGFPFAVALPKKELPKFAFVFNKHGIQLG